MNAKTSTPVPVFEKILGAFATGGFTYADVLTQLKRLLATGASPAVMLESFRRRELIDPLPGYAHQEVLRLLNEAMQRSGLTEAAASESPSARRVRAVAAAQPSVFERVLGAYQTGGFTHADVLALLKRLLATGASPTELAEILRRRELIEPLPADSHAEILEILNDAIQRAAAESTAAASTTGSVETTAAEAGAGDAAIAGSEAGAAGVIAAAATARETDLAADLAAVRTGFESQRLRIRELEDSLAETTAGSQAARTHAENALRESQRQQLETLALRAALAERAAAEAELHTELQAMRRRADEARREAEREQAELRSLRDSHAVRDAQCAALKQEHDKLAAALAAQAKAAAGLQADLQSAHALRETLAEHEVQLQALQRERAELLSALAAGAETRSRLEAQWLAQRAQADTLGVELKASQESVAELTARITRDQAHLDSVRTELGAVKSQASSRLELLRTREWRRGFDRSDPGESARIPQSAKPLARETAVDHGDDVDEVQSDAMPPKAKPRAAEAAAGAGLARGAGTSPPGRVIAWGAAGLAGVLAVWLFAQRAPQPVPVPAPLKAAAAIPAGTVIRDCPTCPAMTVLPAGRFKQGSDTVASGAAAFEKPVHWVRIGHPFAMSTNLVTVGEFQQFIAATGADMQGCDIYDGEWKHSATSSWANPGFPQTAKHPVTCASWNDAELYARWLSTTTGHRYRLPSASEWEFAARAGGGAVVPWGADAAGACADANVADKSAAHRYPGWAAFACDDGYVYTAPVGSFKVNSFGLSDMLGNVLQWTEDCWHADYTGAPIDGSPRRDGDCTQRELRGGSWFSTPAYVRADYRNRFAADYRTSSVGIRLIREFKP